MNMRQRHQNPAHPPFSRWRGLGPYLAMAPALVYLLAMFFVPVALLLGLSVVGYEGELTLEHYRRLVEVPVYLDVLASTARTAIWTTLLCLIGGFPVAYLLARIDKNRRNWLFIFVLMPFWTSFLIRTFAWIVLLGRNGAVNGWLEALGIISSPANLIYNFTGVMIGMTHALMPLAILLMVAVMDGIDGNLSRAAATLGAKGGTRFWRVFFPLSIPGVAASGLLVFITALAFFIIPAILGGAKDTMIVQLIIFQVRDVLNWQFAGAIGVLLLVSMLIVFYFYDQVFGLSTLTGGAGDAGAGTRATLFSKSLRSAGGSILRILAWLFDRAGGLLEKVLGKFGTKGGLENVGTLPWVTSLTIIGFLALPTFFIVPVSFTSKVFLGWPPEGFSLQWYESVFASPVWFAAAARSFIVAILSAFLAMLLAVPCAFALARSRFIGKRFVFAFLISPMIVPHIFIAVGLFFLYSKIGLAGTTVGLVLGHTVLSIPYVVVTVLAIIKGYDENLDKAAATLGANKLRTFWRITFPILRPGMIAAFMFAFILSFDELTIALFVTGGKVTTLPKQMFDDAILSVTPELAAVSALLLAFMTGLIVVSELLRRRSY